MTVLLKAIECQSEELDAPLPACATYLLYDISKFLHQILHTWSLIACSQLYGYPDLRLQGLIWRSAEHSQLQQDSMGALL